MSNITPAKLTERYARITKQLEDLFAKNCDPIARMATIVALLHHKLPHYFWTGFYRLSGDDLLVGPYQGPLACAVLPRPAGVCWAGVLRNESLLVPDVAAFPGHVTCDSRSRSEVVIPCRAKDCTLLGVLDVDSDRPAAFCEVDVQCL